MENNLELLAKKTASNLSLPNGRQAALDPQWILLILEVLENLLPLIKKCVESRNLSKVADKPGLLQRRLAMLNVRKTMGSRLFRENGDQVYEALRKTAMELPVEQVEAIYNEI